MRKLLLLTIALFGLAACKTVKINNGEVPSKYLAQAKKLEGVYHGSFQGLRGRMVISFEGNRPYLRMVDNAGNSLILPSCGTELQQLEWASVTKKGQVKSVGFKFHPGSCYTQGREITLSFNRKYNTIHASIFYERAVERICHWEIVDPRWGPQEFCRLETRDVYLRGKFSR